MIRTLRRWRYQPDHYYWITATMAARGFQSATRRLVAAFVLVRGVIAVMMILSPAGPQGAVNRSIAVMVFVSCLVIVGYWSRRRWPTRNQSLLFVGMLTAGICAGTLTRSDHVSGVMVGMMFAALTGYTVFFHTARYLVPILVAATATILIPIARIAASGDFVRAVCLFASAAMVVAAVASVSQMLVHLLGIKVLLTDIEPVTGLLNRTAFDEATGAFIASRSRRDDRQLVVVVAHLDQLAVLEHASGPTAGERVRVSVGQTLRETTRHDAIVGHSDTAFLIADSFASADATPLIDRLRGGVWSAARMTLSIGVACTPMRALAAGPPPDIVDELVELATTAMQEAVLAGGNTTKYVLCERPAALDDRPAFGTEDAY